MAAWFTPQMVGTFLVAFLTTFITGLSGVMVQGGSVYTWPSAPAAVFFALGGILSGVLRMQSLNATPPPQA